jgi:hypothetical protein
MYYILAIIIIIINFEATDPQMANVVWAERKKVKAMAWECNVG